MKSPFPGMDPYIEACGLWADFHDDLIAEIKRSLAARLPERYFVQTGERSYVVMLVGRESHAPYCRVWPAYFRHPLPEVPVPLASPDPDIPLALQPMIDAVYERSRYARRLDYSKPISPPLSPEESAWLAARLSTLRS